MCRAALSAIDTASIGMKPRPKPEPELTQAWYTVRNECVDSLVSDSRICSVLMKLIAEAVANDEKEHFDPEQSEKPIRDEGATLLKT